MGFNVGWPADCRASGVMALPVSHQGRLLEKDLGTDTATLAEDMTEYNPDETRVEVRP